MSASIYKPDNDQPFVLDDVDRRLILLTQAGLPLTTRPYDTVAEQAGIGLEEVLTRMQRMKAHGVIRRVALVPNHYRLGYKANGMSVWDVESDHIDELGEKVGRLNFVSHAYHRPRHLPEWPYNFFAMVHGRTREEVEDQVREISRILGNASRKHDVLYSTRILKKTGLRLRA